MKIYLAGPLFSTAEQEFNSRLKQHLIEYGHEVWLPQDESDEQTGEKVATEIFSKDVEGIDWADVVVANMDGRTRTRVRVGNAGTPTAKSRW